MVDLNTNEGVEVLVESSSMKATSPLCEVVKATSTPFPYKPNSLLKKTL